MAGIAEFDSSGIAKSVEAFTTLESPKKRELKGPAESKY